MLFESLVLAMVFQPPSVKDTERRSVEFERRDRDGQKKRPRVWRRQTTLEIVVVSIPSVPPVACSDVYLHFVFNLTPYR